MHRRESRGKPRSKKKSPPTRKAKARKKESLHRIKAGDRPFETFKRKIEDHIRATRKETVHIYGKFQVIVNILAKRVLYLWGDGSLPYDVKELIFDYCFTIESITDLIEFPHHPKAFGVIDGISYSIIPTDYYYWDYRSSGEEYHRTRFGASIGIVPMCNDLIITQAVQVKLYFTQKYFTSVFVNFFADREIDSPMQLLDMIENVYDKDIVTLIGYFPQKEINGLLWHLYCGIVCDNALLRGITDTRVSDFKWRIVTHLIQLMLNIHIFKIQRYNLDLKWMKIMCERFDGDEVFIERPLPDFYPAVIYNRREVWNLTEIIPNDGGELLFNDTVPLWIEKTDGSWELTDIYITIVKIPDFPTAIYKITIQAKMREVDESGEDIPFTFSEKTSLRPLYSDDIDGEDNYLCGIRIYYIKQISQENYQRWITSQYHCHPFINIHHMYSVYISSDEYTGEPPVIDQETIPTVFRGRKLLEIGQEFQYEGITYEWNGVPIVEEFEADQHTIGIMQQEFYIPQNIISTGLIEDYFLSFLRKEMKTPRDSWDLLDIIELLHEISP